MPSSHSPDDGPTEQLLRERGLDRLGPVKRAARRPGCEVWAGRLQTAYGDADFELQIYPLAEDPVAIVDLEEEITALLDEASPRLLAHEVRDDAWAILVTCASQDAPVFRKFFQTDHGEQSPSMTYHPQLRRILGGDYFHQLQGRWMKACLVPIARARQLIDLLPAAQQAWLAAPDWPDKHAQPLPQLLAVLAAPDLAVDGLPEADVELSVMQFMVAGPEVIQQRPPDGAQERTAFARQLFGFLRAQHRAGLCFNRDAGSCLRPEFLLADGALSDVYFLDRQDETAPKRIEIDLWNALLCAHEAAGEDPRTGAELISVALAQYAPAVDLTRDVLQLVEGAAQGLARGQSDGLKAVMNLMTRAMVR
jgi:hypothetical protein